jgi:membrane fusion protein, multidrug efflux system
MKASRIVAIALVGAAGAWIGSGYFTPHETGESKAAIQPDMPLQKPFRVIVAPSELTQHSRKLVVSGRTEADKKINIIARASGVLTELRVKRGDRVKEGDIVAVLSDEAREAQVMQARALLTQRRTEYEAKKRLIDNGTWPRLDQLNLESQVKAAEASVAVAEAERDRGKVRAPWDGIITDVVAEVGNAAFSMAGKEIAQLIALDPMLAVVEVADRKLGGIKAGDPAQVKLVTGQTLTGKIRFVSRSATAATRTYRVEVEIPNPTFEVADGVTAEVAIALAPVPATRVARSALTLSSTGDIGIRAVDAQRRVFFVPVSIIEDERGAMWVDGIAPGTRVILQGQDFVREGQVVEPVTASPLQAATN